MLFKSTTAAACLLAIVGSSSAKAIPQKRATSTSSLYAYGSGANGARVFYDDGLAYIGLTPPTFNSSVVTNITFTYDADSTTTPWTITANSTDSPSVVSFNETLELYIVPTTGSFAQAGFVSASDNSSAPDGAVTTGFTWYGSTVAYAASDSDYQSMFWANVTEDPSVWELIWNAASTDLPTGSFPVTLKKTAPTV